MKTKVAILSLAAICMAGSLMAQEIDDMYFSRKDREKQNAAKADETTYSASKKSKGNDEAVTGDESINPTDTYSARSTNPEYVSRANSEQAATDNQDYYVTDYRNSTANNLNKFNNNYNNWYNSTWYNNGYYGNSMYSGFNSPYYYNSFANPWMSPYYQPGWGSSMSFYYGSPYFNNYGYSPYGYGGYYDPFYSPYYGYGGGWGMSYGMGMGYGYPYYGYGSGWGMSYGLGSYYYWGGRPTVVVVNNGGSGEGYRGPVYGKRADRGGMTTYNHQGNTSRNRQQSAATRAYTPYQGNTASNGRVATTSTNTNRTGGQGDYYNRTWRSAARQQYSSPTNNNSNYGNNNSRSSWNNQQNQSNWNNSNNSFQHNNNSFTPSRSFNSGGGGSMRAPSSGGGLGGRTRGH